MSIYQFDAFELDLKARRLRRDGSAVALKPKVFALLCHLVEHRDRLLTRSELMDKLWPNQDIGDASLTQTIYELRKALGERHGKPRYIETVARLGFRFHGTVSECAPTAATSIAGISSVVVLPFSALPDSERISALAYGISTTIVAGLASLPGLRIHQAPSLARFSDPTRDILAAGREAGANAVLDGTLHCVGQRFRLVVRLIRVVDEMVLWAEKYDDSLARLFTVEDGICLQIAQLIAPSSGGINPQLPARNTRDSVAHELYLQCRFHWAKWNPEGWMRAIECGEKAIERDPGHAGAHVWTGAAYATLAIAGLQAPPDAFARAEAYIQRALELDDTSGDGYECRGAIAHFYHWNWSAAEQDLARSLELAPSGQSGRGLYAILLVITGRADEGLSQVQLARKFEPLSPLVNTGVGEVYFYRREIDRAIEAFQHTLTLDPFYINARFLLGQAYAARGDAAKALAAFQIGAEHAGIDPHRSGLVGYSLALNGDARAARNIYANLIADSRLRYVDPYEIALVSLGLDDLDATFEHLDAALRQRSPQLIYLGVKGMFDRLHTDPRFHNLLRSVGLELQGFAMN